MTNEERFVGLEIKLERLAELEKKNDILETRLKTIEENSFYVKACAVAAALGFLVAAGFEYFHLPRHVAEYAKAAATKAVVERISTEIPDKVNALASTLSGKAEEASKQLDVMLVDATRKIVAYNQEAEVILVPLRKFKSADGRIILEKVTILDASIANLSAKEASIPKLSAATVDVGEYLRVGGGTGIAITHNLNEPVLAFGHGGFKNGLVPYEKTVKSFKLSSAGQFTTDP